MSKPITCLVVIFLLASVEVSLAQCRKAKDNEVPHGANELIQMETQMVPSIYGKVSFQNGDAAEEAVVEVFRHKGDDSSKNINSAWKRKRIKACVTGKDGKFAFSGLKPGTYLLRVGISDASPVKGMNEAYMILVLKPGAKEAGAVGLEITLTVGT